MKVKFFAAYLAVILSMIAGFPGSVAANEYVECVQNQLTALGYDPGGIDGQLGPKTGAAFRSYLNASSKEAASLSRESAITWCRKIADDALRSWRFWPSQNRPTVVVDNNRGLLQEALIRSAFTQVTNFFREKYHVQTIGRVDLVGGEDPRLLGKYVVQLMHNRNQNSYGVARDIRDVCGNSRILAGVAYRNQIVVCWETTEGTIFATQGRVNAKWFDRMNRLLPRMMAHEYMHHLQSELSEEKTAPQRHRGQRQIAGPSWLSEGTAEFFEYRFGALGTHFDVFNSGQLRREANESDRSLKKMRSRGTVKSNENYALSHYASYLLARKYGTEALFQYWEELGKGKSWEQAFVGVFHMELSEYEAMFPKFIENYQAGLKFTSNN